MAVITISSSFGSGGSVVAARVAEALGWKFVNRAIPVEVAAELGAPLELIEHHDERSETGWRRLIERLNVLLRTYPGDVGVADVIDAVSFRQATERALRKAAEDDVVVVGRAAALVLSDRPDALHVRLDGPREARLRQGAAALKLSAEEAASKLDVTDRARAAYVRELYGRDWRDPALYHLVVDATRIPIPACTAIILEAAKATLPRPAGT